MSTPATSASSLHQAQFSNSIHTQPSTSPNTMPRGQSVTLHPRDQVAEVALNIEELAPLRLENAVHVTQPTALIPPATQQNEARPGPNESSFRIISYIVWGRNREDCSLCATLITASIILTLFILKKPIND